MKKVLSQISKPPLFTRGIEKAKLSKRFYQPAFIMYNGRKPVQTEDDSPFSGRSLTVQSVSLQFMTDADKVV